MDNAKLFLGKILSSEEGEWNSRRVRQDPARDRKITVVKRSANWARENQRVQERFVERELAKQRDHAMRINAWRSQYYRDYWNTNVAGKLNEFRANLNMEGNWQRNEKRNHWNGRYSNEISSIGGENYNQNYYRYNSNDYNGNYSQHQFNSHTRESYSNARLEKYSY